MTGRTVLVVEDDAPIRRGIVDAFSFEGFETLEAGDGDAGLDLALSATYDLLLLDLSLPGTDGLAILERVRAERPAAPVIIVTAHGEEDERVEGLRLGADDYVVKPFSVRELVARAEAVLRRTPERPVEVERIRFDGGEADLERRELRFDDGASEELSERECALLAHLARNSDRAVSREEILRRVWGIDPAGVETRTIDMLVARLREKLRDDPAEKRVIATVRGKGYMLGDAAHVE